MDIATLGDHEIDLHWLLTGTGQMRRDAPVAPAGPIDERLLADALRLVDDWLDANDRVMEAARKAEIAASIYAMAIEDAGDGTPVVTAGRVAQILRLVA